MEVALFLPWFWFFHICTTHVQLHCPIPAGQMGDFFSPASRSCWENIPKHSKWERRVGLSFFSGIPLTDPCQCPQVLLPWPLNVSKRLGPKGDIQEHSVLRHRAPSPFVFVLEGCTSAFLIHVRWFCHIEDFGCWHHEGNEEYCNGKATRNCFESTAALHKARWPQKYVSDPVN